MYGTQANLELVKQILMFENDVKMYGTQAVPAKMHSCSCLRMM